MLTTEEEASTKRCQESFPAADALSQYGSAEAVAAPVQMVGMPYGPNGPSVSYGSSMSFARHTAPTNCIGSVCMAWRWHWGAVRDGLHEHVTTPEGEKLGYCGKAGQP